MFENVSPQSRTELIELMILCVVRRKHAQKRGEIFGYSDPLALGVLQTERIRTWREYRSVSPPQFLHICFFLR